MQKILLLWSAVATIGGAQIILADVKVPIKRSLQAIKEFYVYSFDEAPDRPLGRPFVKFKSFVANLDAEHKDYKGIEISLIRHSDFAKLIDPKRFCCGAEDVRAGKCKEEGQLSFKDAKLADDETFRVTVSVSDSGEKEKKLRASGVYILAISNCGELDGGDVHGEITVSHAYGFLPGNEYHKMPFFFWVAVLYAVFALLWAAVSYQWQNEVTKVHKSISGVLLFGFLEALAWYISYVSWNSSGLRSDFLHMLAISLSALKTTFSCVMMLLISLGWSVTRPYLDKALMQKIQLLAVAHLLSDVAQQFVMNGNGYMSLPIALCAIAPATLVNAGMFFWIFSALSSIIETFQDRRQLDKLGLFQRVWAVLLVGVVASTFGMLSEVAGVVKFAKLDEWAHDDGTWKHEWIAAVGAPHAIYLCVLALMMYFLAPFQGQLMGTVATDNAQERKGDVDDVFADQDDEKEDASFWAGGQAIGNVTPVVEATPVAAREDENA